MAARRRLLADAPPGRHHRQGAAPSEWSNVNGWLSQATPVFGLRLWVLIGIAVGAAIVLVLLLIFVCLSRRRRRRDDLIAANLYPAADTKLLKQHLQQATPTKDIQEIVRRQHQTPPPPPAVQLAKAEPQTPPPPQRAQAPAVPAPPTRKAPGSGLSATTSGGSERDGATPRSVGSAAGMPEVSHLGWGHWFTLRDLEEATDGLAEENVIGEGGYGIVYRGTLHDSTMIAVKNLLNNRGQAEKEFKVEVEAIGRVRHKNLVRLLGYCVEGAYRMLVYEYVDNGNLDQWLHGDVGEVSPLTWDIRMNIMLATAKGLAYLHEGLEPKVVHRDIKASNILLDQHWNAKVSDFGLAKLLCSEKSYVTTRVMGTFGYVAPEYASTGMLNERSDVYSFGVLIMEIITGRSPVDYTRAPGEVNLVEWLKNMVAERKAEEVVDPKMTEKPSPKTLKRALLVALRCVDPDANKRPKMGHVIHMLEMDHWTRSDCEDWHCASCLLAASKIPNGKLVLVVPVHGAANQLSSPPSRCPGAVPLLASGGAIARPATRDAWEEWNVRPGSFWWFAASRCDSVRAQQRRRRRRMQCDAPLEIGEQPKHAVPARLTTVPTTATAITVESNRRIESRSGPSHPRSHSEKRERERERGTRKGDNRRGA